MPVVDCRKKHRYFETPSNLASGLVRRSKDYGLKQRARIRLSRGTAGCIVLVSWSIILGMCMNLSDVNGCEPLRVFLGYEQAGKHLKISLIQVYSDKGAFISSKPELKRVINHATYRKSACILSLNREIEILGAQDIDTQKPS
jgi:hypothetical protein